MNTQIMNAIERLYKYIDIMQINTFFVPVLTGRGIAIQPLDAPSFADWITDYYTANDNLPNCVYLNDDELFLRFNTTLSLTKIQLPSRGRYSYIQTQAKRYGQWPKHHNMIARGFEIFCTEIAGGVHRGDDISEVDIVHPYYGRVECKTMRGEFSRKRRLIE